MYRVVAPVPSRVEVMRCMVAVIEAYTVTLFVLLALVHIWWSGSQGEAYHNIYHRDARSKVGFGVDLVNERVLAPVAYHECETHDGER